MIKRLAGSISLLLLLAGLALTSSQPHIARASAHGGDSTRRGPVATSDSALALEKLVGDLNAILAMPEAGKGKVGVQIRSLASNRVLFSMNPDAPLTPASTTKVVTAFTALNELGTNYMVKTILAADAKPRDGIVRGNLYVKGFGDPFLSTTEIDELIDQIVQSGVKQIDGNIVGDGTFFDNKTERIQYSGDKDVVVPLPPIAALTIHNGTFTVIVSSSRIAGVPCNVQTYPHSAAFEIQNSSVTSSAPQRRQGRRGKKRAALETSSEQRFADRTVALDSAALDDDSAPRFGDEPAGTYATDEPLNGRKPTKAPAQPAGRGTVKKTVKKKGAAAQPARGTRGRTRSQPATTSRAKSSTTNRTKAAAAKAPVAKAPVAKAPVAKAPVAKAPVRTAPKLDVPVIAGTGPLRVALATAPDGRQIITVTGSLPPGRTSSYRFGMRNPPMVIAGMIMNRLRSHGITVNGGVTAGSAPAKYRILAEAGRPLIEIIHLVMKNSNNFLAEYVFKMIGGAAGGQQETAVKTQEKIQSRMNTCRVPFSRCVINDGSGLSRANLLTASALVGILEAAHADRRLFESFYSSMSVAGVDGTLRRRMKGTAAERNVHGKTGTLNNVSALAGYVTTRDGELICFSMLMNGGNQGAYRAVQDKVAARLAAFSYRDIPTIPVATPAKTPEKAPSKSGKGSSKSGR